MIGNMPATTITSIKAVIGKTENIKTEICIIYSYRGAFLVTRVQRL